jgi:hypothetical protein
LQFPHLKLSTDQLFALGRNSWLMCRVIEQISRDRH